MRNKYIQSMAITALLCALIIVLGFTPLGLIPLGFINVTTLCIPVIIGTLLLGRNRGVILGACFGLVSFYKAMTAASALVVPILQSSIPALFALCLLPRILFPIVTHLVYSLFLRGGKNPKIGIATAAVIGSLTNTVLYLGMLVALYMLFNLDAPAIIATVLGIAGGAGVSEAVVAGIIVTPIVIALKKVYKGKDSHA